MPPVLLLGRHRIRLLDADEEAALEVEQRIEVQEDVVDLVAADDALLLDQLLELLQELEVLHVRALRLDHLVDDVLALGALDAREGGVRGCGGAKLAHGHERVQHAVDNIGDLSISLCKDPRCCMSHLYEARGVVTIQVAEDEAVLV